jgi:dTMP kinase
VIITFEGGEGTGKTTNAGHLCSYLTSKGLPWLSFREPGGSAFSEDLRGFFLSHDLDVMAELLLLLSARRQNIVEIIEPSLALGKILVIDRFVDSTLVYQGMVGGLGHDRVREIMELTRTWIEPDLTFVMDVSPECAFSRIKPGDRFERRSLEYHRELRDAFVSLACTPRHRIIDTGLSREVVRERISSETELFLKSRY